VYMVLECHGRVYQDAESSATSILRKHITDEVQSVDCPIHLLNYLIEHRKLLCLMSSALLKTETLPMRNVKTLSSCHLESWNNFGKL